MASALIATFLTSFAVLASDELEQKALDQLTNVLSNELNYQFTANAQKNEANEQYVSVQVLEKLDEKAAWIVVNGQIDELVKESGYDNLPELLMTYSTVSLKAGPGARKETFVNLIGSLKPEHQKIVRNILFNSNHESALWIETLHLVLYNVEAELTGDELLVLNITEPGSEKRRLIVIRFSYCAC